MHIITLLGQIAISSNDSVRIIVAQSLSAFYSEEPNSTFLEGKWDIIEEVGVKLFVWLVLY